MRLIKRLAPLWVLALLAALLAVSVGPAQAASSTSVTVDGSQGGRPFDGIGAISGGGGNSRLLTDYPAAQQKQILDYLFKPGYGADLQILKAEIGGDANSTDGSEPSIEHTRGTVNCNAGCEFWLMQQAKARNPTIKLYGLAWAAPGWINGGFWSTDTISYTPSAPAAQNTPGRPACPAEDRVPPEQDRHRRPAPGTAPSGSRAQRAAHQPEGDCPPADPRMWIQPDYQGRASASFRLCSAIPCMNSRSGKSPSSRRNGPATSDRRMASM
jgi:hypothetical protein